MPQKQCPQCPELVDEAKAFCPACGHSFVDEERRTNASAYEKMDSTVQMGNTMYNAMLSDMGLNVKKQPEAERRVEVLKPVAVQSAQVLQPAAPRATPESTATSEATQQKSSKKFWIITIAVAAVLLLLFVAAVAAVGLYLYFRA
ncbi:MAG TPA: hypothetical protein VL501_06880 [Pyrinomonadaceae bacterium]|nr:hypothetical protein [Pyrinomonadaceae bacterium]